MAISLAEFSFASATNVTATLSAAVGDLIIVAIQDYPIGTPAISDNESGAYTLTTGITESGSGQQWSVGYKVVTVAGTPTITGDANTNRIIFWRWSGFVGTPTMLGSDIATASSTGGTAVNSGSFLASKNNEYAIAISGSSQGLTGTPTGWAADGGPGNQLAGYHVTAQPFSSGTSVSLVGTLGSSAYWVAGVYGFYDAPAAGGGSVHTLFSQNFY